MKDAAAFAGFAAKTFQKPRYTFSGIARTYVALQVADLSHFIAGVALVGFTAQSLDISLFEQTVYRPLYIFEALDLDKSGALDTEELKKEDSSAKSLNAQLQILDLNKSGTLDRDEFMGGNLSRRLLDAPSLREYRKREASYKRPAEIIKDARFDVAFFQGELDNQTPAYNARAVQLTNTLLWKKNNLHFRFFGGLSHALDKRADYHDIVYQRADAQALRIWRTDLDSY